MSNQRKEFFFLKVIRRAGIIGRIMAVALICGCIINFTIYLQNHKIVTYDVSAKSAQSTENEATTVESSTTYLKEDESFEKCYVMISNAGNEGRPIMKEPGNEKEVVNRLSNGTIVWAVKRGTYQGNSYYLLEDNTYLLDEDEYVLELKSYTRLSGYVNITFVSATGVKLRAWANFSDDNVIKRAFVGDQVKIVGKIVTKYGEEAYRTEEGLYMTTNSAYYENHIIQENGYGGSAEEEQESSFE